METVVSCRRNTIFEVWAEASMQTCFIFPCTFVVEVAGMIFLPNLTRVTPGVTPVVPQGYPNVPPQKWDKNNTKIMCEQRGNQSDPKFTYLV